MPRIQDPTAIRWGLNPDALTIIIPEGNPYFGFRDFGLTAQILVSEVWGGTSVLEAQIGAKGARLGHVRSRNNRHADSPKEWVVQISRHLVKGADQLQDFRLAEAKFGEQRDDGFIALLPDLIRPPIERDFTPGIREGQGEGAKPRVSPWRQGFVETEPATLHVGHRSEAEGNILEDLFPVKELRRFKIEDHLSGQVHNFIGIPDNGVGGMSPLELAVTAINRLKDEMGEDLILSITDHGRLAAVEITRRRIGG
jgi:hypothetical protein